MIQKQILVKKFLIRKLWGLLVLWCENVNSCVLFLKKEGASFLITNKTKNKKQKTFKKFLIKKETTYKNVLIVDFIGLIKQKKLKKYGLLLKSINNKLYCFLNKISFLVLGTICVAPLKTKFKQHLV